METSTSRIATIRLVGGRPAIDLVNTVSWRGDPARRIEQLRSAGDCLIWIERVGLLAPEALHQLRWRCEKSEDDSEALLASLRHVRAVISQHLVDPPAPGLDALGALIQDTLAACQLAEVDATVRWAPPQDALAPSRLVALDLLDHLSRPRGRLSTCGDPACGWAFVDTSRAHTRRWCHSADCGNRDRARRHYHRTADGAPHGPATAAP